MAALQPATARASQPHHSCPQTHKRNGVPPTRIPEAQRCKQKMPWLATLAAAGVIALQSTSPLACAVDLPPASTLQAGEVIDEPHNCRPSCIWGDVVCRALLGERWSDTRERCNVDDAPDLGIPELQGDAPPPYVSHATPRRLQ